MMIGGCVGVRVSVDGDGEGGQAFRETATRTIMSAAECRSRAARELHQWSIYLKARKRIRILKGHLLNVDVDGISKIEERNDDGRLMALVPSPGTYEHMEWMTAIRKSKSIEALEMLDDWTKGFSQSNVQLESALRRIKVLIGHLNAPPFRLTVEDVW